MRAIRALLLLTLIFTALACGGKTQGQVLTEYGDRYAAKVEQVEKLIAGLPEKGSVTGNKGTLPLDPPLVFDEKARTFNCDILHMEHVTNPMQELPFDLMLSYDLQKHLMWTSPDGFMRRSDSDAGDLASRLDATLSRRYLVIHRTVELVLPEAIDHQSFKPGRVVYEGFVLDLEQDKAVASYRVSARTYAEASYSGGTMDSMIDSVRSGMWTKARDEVKAALEEVTGGSVVLD